MEIILPLCQILTETEFNMLKKIAAATSVIAILAGYALPGAAQSIDTHLAQNPTSPSTETTPITPSTTTTEPIKTPSDTPTTPTETQPMSPSTPSTETTPITPSTTPTSPAIEPPTTPPTETQPMSPPTPLPSTQPVTPEPTTTTPTPTPAAGVKPGDATATTTVLGEETITGIKEVSFPTPPVTPAFFTLPIELRVMKDAAITSNTPITDKNATDLSAWSSAIRACAMDKPAFVRVVGDQKVPFMINGTEGKVRLNANDKPVCSV